MPFAVVSLCRLYNSKLKLETETVHLTHISELLAPFLSAPLSELQLSQLASYLEILHRWNARMNLTAIRDPEPVVTRHFGESLFAAQKLYSRSPEPEARLLDIGSGAGFPGIPIKIWSPELHVTLLESQNKKATFLREVVRALELKNVTVFAGRAEDLVLPKPEAHSPKPVVTLRAVEKFDRILPVAAQLAAGGRLALLVGSVQVEPAKLLAPTFRWSAPLPIPQSLARVVLVGESA